MRRVLTTWLLLLAFGLPLVQPASGAWRCPNGTLCIAGPDGRYHCTGGTCRMACCQGDGEHASAGCGSVCRHGAMVADEATAGSGETQPGIGCSCHFTATVRVAAASLTRTQPDLDRVADDGAIVPESQELSSTRSGAGQLPVPDASPPPDPSLSATRPRAPPHA